MSSLRMLAEKYNDSEYSLPSDYYQEEVKLKQFAFMIITPDGVRRGLASEILKFLLKHVQFEIKMAKMGTITNRQLELLYKYAFKRMFLKGELVYWWLLQESWRVGPCVALLLYSKDFTEGAFVDFLLNIKGDYNDPDKQKLRSYFASTSMIMNIIHSSDDNYNMIREASLFFDNKDIINTIRCPEKYSVEFEVISDLCKFTNQCSIPSEEILNIVNNRLWSELALMCKDNLMAVKKRFRILIETLPYDEFVNKISHGNYKIVNLLKIAYILSGKKDVPIAEFEVLFKDNIIFDQWEKVVLKNILLQEIWINQ